MNLQLADRDRDLLDVLVHRIRVLSLGQIGRTWFAAARSPERAAASRVRRLKETGFVEVVCAMVHPEISLTGPLLDWSPGAADPDLAALSSQLYRRWRMPPRSTRLVYAAPRSNKTFGGHVGSRPPRPVETSHDVHLAAVFLWFRINRPAFAKRWVSEEELYWEGWGRNGRLPDALIRRPGPPTKSLIIEFGGCYSHQKLMAFHESFKDRKYQIW